MGMKPRYVFRPWKRCEWEAMNGKVFGIFPYAITKERKDKFYFSDKIMKNNTMLFYSTKYFKKSPNIKKIKDLKSYKIGGVLGYNYVSAFKNAGLNVDYVTNDDLNVKKLYHNRINIALWDQILGWHLIEKIYPKEKKMFKTLDITLEKIVPSIQQGDSYLMISKKYPNSINLKNKFNQALKRIKKNGTYNKIFEKYMSK